MKTSPPLRVAEPHAEGFPDVASIAALREGLSATEAVARYLEGRKAVGQSARGLVGRIRRQLVAFAQSRRRQDMVDLLKQSASLRAKNARAVSRAIEALRLLPAAAPLIWDEVGAWIAPRAAAALQAHGLNTLAALTVRIPRRRRWWTGVPGLGATGAAQIEAFFAAHPQLTERARALVPVGGVHDVVPWERLVVPHEVDGAFGIFRAPRASSTLTANNDFAAVQAWLALHESPATQRAYRKEAERVILWAIVERRKALSSLTTEDAIAYRAFLCHPSPRSRWVGQPRPRSTPDWRPFTGGLSARSAAYALSVVGAMFRWLIAQRYVLANPFAGIKVRGGSRSESLVAQRYFAESEWAMVQTVADGLEWSYGWKAPAAQRLRFVLDFAYATGLRASELVSATLGQIEIEQQGDRCLHLVGKGQQSRQSRFATARKSGARSLPRPTRAADDADEVELQDTFSWQPRSGRCGLHNARSAVECDATVLYRDG